MKKHLLIAAIAITALASCSSNDFVGDESPQTSSGNVGAIQFSSTTPKITRGAQSDASDLGYSFAVYATKTVPGTPDAVTSNVFAHNAIGSPDANGNHTPYWVWYNTGTFGTTSSNTNNWEYVGAAGAQTIPNGTFTLPSAQEIKYWDYSATRYDFVAYKATVETGTGADKRPMITNYTTSGFTVQATPAQLAGLYVADKKVITSSNYRDVVQFTFRSSATKVRLGIYETIPGYKVQNVTFRPATSGQNQEFASTSINACLSGSFNGTSSSTEGTYNVTYNATTGIAEFTTSAEASDYFDFGSFPSYQSPLGESSTDPTWAGSSSYQSVLPNTNHVANMILYVDYELYNDVSGETIVVSGAKAVVPAMYMTWNPNYAYTYLFKISDNTNGTTGAEGGTSPAGLFPITFDAVTIAATGDQSVGTITTVSTPAITTYQAGSVGDGVYSTNGITYANANGPIYITVNIDGTLQTLTNKIKLYKLDPADADATEADLIIVPAKLTNKEVTGEVADKLTILSGDGETVQSITFAASTSAKFTPAAGQTYAVEFTDSGVKHYKVIKVATPQP